MQWTMPLLLTLLIALGCNHEPPKLTPAKRVEKPLTVEVPNLETKPAPESSEPAARMIVDAAIVAHTDDDPQKIETLRSVRIRRTGAASFSPVEKTPVESVVTMRWPNSYHIGFSLGPRQGFFLCYNAESGHSNTNADLAAEPMSAKQLVERRQDNSWEWLWTLVPLTDPEVVLAIDTERMIEEQPCDAIRVWHPSLADAILYFDKKSHHLRGLLYIGSEQDADIVKLNIIHTTDDFAGITLPKTMTQRSDMGILFEWTFDSVEPDPKIEEGLFKGEAE